jgi:hypothetical protein
MLVVVVVVVLGMHLQVQEVQHIHLEEGVALGEELLEHQELMQQVEVVAVLLVVAQDLEWRGLVVLVVPES